MLEIKEWRFKDLIKLKVDIYKLFNLNVKEKIFFKIREKNFIIKEIFGV